MSAPGRRITTTPLGEPLDAYGLNYHGDVTAGFPGTILGPNTSGEYVVVVAATYNAATDMTRIGVRFATPDDLATSVPL